MSEQVNLSKAGEWFKHYLYSQVGHDNQITKITKHPDYDSSNLKVEMSINGVALSVVEFELLLMDWSQRMTEKIRDDLNLDDFETAVREKSKNILYALINKIDDIDDIDTLVE